MNYNMQGITKMIPKLFAMLKLAKVEIKKKHQVLMVDKTTSFKKKGKGKERELQEECIPFIFEEKGIDMV